MIKWQPIEILEDFPPEAKEALGWVLFSSKGDWNKETIDSMEVCLWAPTILNWRTYDRQTPTFKPTHFLVIGKLP